ncbi:MAG: hypothetical protein HDR35_04380 [Treponema sp.]|nr:hypothetical protein [Treponema sp.]
MKKYKKQLLKNAAQDIIVEPIENALGKYVPLRKIFYHIKERNFCQFLESLYDSMKRNKNLSREEVDRLVEEVGNSTSKQYMSTILDNLCFSKGLFAVKILALITSKYMLEEDLDCCDLYLISALNDLYDTDLDTFFHTFMNNSTVIDGVSVLYEYTEENRIVLDKLQNLNIFGRDRTPGRLTDGKQKPLLYEITEVSQRLHCYCKEIIKPCLD